ncbi:MAG: hypothetical protein F6K09_03265, partial [Merismopedia sp. SIO2A8]|nr:hypothetical protein [Merismopedia sp. SIO2A8]
KSAGVSCPMFQKILIATRGEIACRIIKTRHHWNCHFHSHPSPQKHHHWRLIHFRPHHRGAI